MKKILAIFILLAVVGANATHVKDHQSHHASTDANAHKKAHKDIADAAKHVKKHKAALIELLAAVSAFDAGDCHTAAKHTKKAFIKEQHNTEDAKKHLAKAVAKANIHHNNLHDHHHHLLAAK